VSVSAHLSRIDVEEGQFVDKGQIIGRSGATGLAGGDHLHLGMFVQGVAVDPIEWLDERWIRHRILPRIGSPASG
jgi:murein DD-endopeptidase MepM/ murein hydrolase activator NlpD